MTNQPLNKPQDDEAITSDQDDSEFEDAFKEFSGKSAGVEDRDEYHIDREQIRKDQESDLESGTEPGDRDTDDISEKLKTLEAENEKLRHSDASQRGRLGAYQRRINELESATQQIQSDKPTDNNTGKPQNEDQQRQELAESMDMQDWEEFKEDFPDMARAFESRLKADDARQAQMKQELDELRASVQPIQQQAHEQQLQSEYARLEDRHEDWREVVNAPEFDKWLQSQNQSIRALADSTSADDASALLDFYKNVRPPGEGDNRAKEHEKRQNRLANAQTVSRRGTATRGAAPDDFEAAFDYYAEKKSRRR
jgi:DNA repair exonuclease SbcCD ATPase subunit